MDKVLVEIIVVGFTVNVIAWGTIGLLILGGY